MFCKYLRFGFLIENMKFLWGDGGGRGVKTESKKDKEKEKNEKRNFVLLFD